MSLRNAIISFSILTLFNCNQQIESSQKLPDLGQRRFKSDNHFAKNRPINFFIDFDDSCVRAFTDSIKYHGYSVKFDTEYFYLIIRNSNNDIYRLTTDYIASSYIFDFDNNNFYWIRKKSLLKPDSMYINYTLNRGKLFDSTDVIIRNFWDSSQHECVSYGFYNEPECRPKLEKIVRWLYGKNFRYCESGDSRWKGETYLYHKK